MPDASSTKRKKAGGSGLLCCFRRSLLPKSKELKTSEDGQDDLRLLLTDAERPLGPECFGLAPSELQFADEGELVLLFERPRLIPNVRKYCLETLMKIRP